MENLNDQNLYIRIIRKQVANDVFPKEGIKDKLEFNTYMKNKGFGGIKLLTISKLTINETELSEILLFDYLYEINNDALKCLQKEENTILNEILYYVFYDVEKDILPIPSNKGIKLYEYTSILKSIIISSCLTTSLITRSSIAESSIATSIIPTNSNNLREKKLHINKFEDIDILIEKNANNLYLTKKTLFAIESDLLFNTFLETIINKINPLPM